MVYVLIAVSISMALLASWGNWTISPEYQPSRIPTPHFLGHSLLPDLVAWLSVWLSISFLRLLAYVSVHLSPSVCVCVCVCVCAVSYTHLTLPTMAVV